MNVFFEFHKIVQHLQAEHIDYALIGGVAVAFHAEPRFTKDIDLLIRECELGRVTEVLADLIWLKQKRHSELDQADIEKLTDEKA